MEDWERGFHMAQQPARETYRTRLTAMYSHMLFTFRSVIGVLASGIIVWLPGLDTFLTPQAKFFAIIIPPLAVSKHVGGTLKALLLGLPFIIAMIYFAAAIIFATNDIAIHFVVLALGVFAFEWGGQPFGGLGKKLASGLYATVLLASVNNTPLQTNNNAISLTAGLAVGYLGALVG
jgi:hypothetical protein